MTLYAILALAVLLAAGALWLYRRGREAERGDASGRAVEAAGEARKVEDEIAGMGDDELRDSARRRAGERMQRPK